MTGGSGTLRRGEGPVAVFAGTSEGRLLCERLSSAGVPARAFVATEYGRALVEGLPGVEVRAGRLGSDAMAEGLEGCSLVVDAAHPYATLVHGNVEAAACTAGLVRLRLVRDRQEAGEGAVWATDSEEAASFLAAREGNVFSTCGSKNLSVLASAPGLAERLYVRVLPTVEALRACEEAGVAPSHVVCMQGPFSHELNLALIREFDAKWVITKDSGAPGGFMAKVTAAEEAGARLVVLERPLPDEEGLSLEEVWRAIVG